MSRLTAKAVFDQLAAEYLETETELLNNTDLSKEDRKNEMTKAHDLVNALRREHDYALKSYFGVEQHTNTKKALKNDLRG